MTGEYEILRATICPASYYVVVHGEPLAMTTTTEQAKQIIVALQNTDTLAATQRRVAELESALVSIYQEAQAHINVEGGCKMEMFLGGCPDCARYYLLDDLLAAAATTPAEPGAGDE